VPDQPDFDRDGRLEQPRHYSRQSQRGDRKRLDKRNRGAMARKPDSGQSWLKQAFRRASGWPVTRP
jgi:hypothetical protein